MLPYNHRVTRQAPSLAGEQSAAGNQLVGPAEAPYVKLKVVPRMCTESEDRERGCRRYMPVATAVQPMFRAHRAPIFALKEFGLPWLTHLPREEPPTSQIGCLTAPPVWLAVQRPARQRQLQTSQV